VISRPDPRALLLRCVLAGAALAGCGTGLTEAPGTPEACAAALLGPVTLLLADDGLSTMGLPDGAVAIPLRWPDGYGLRPGVGAGEIVNERGEAIARIGERVWLGGGFGADDAVFHVCGNVMREDPAR
jgi:hypothetical protein